MSEKEQDDRRVAIRQRVKDLEATLTGNLYDDMGTLRIIRSLKAQIGMYHTEFDETGCIYCSG
jgi:hypothetical protein